jgi:hypothetical protein
MIIININLIITTMVVPVAKLSKACTVFGHLNAGIVGLNPT